MPQIGQFHRDASGFAGQLVTLTLKRELVIVPAEHSDAENAPNYRVHYIAHDGPAPARANSSPKACLPSRWAPPP